MLRTIQDDWDDLLEGKMTKRVELAPCHRCGRPAMIGEGVGNTWLIGCFREDCNCAPVRYADGNNRSKFAAIRTWNRRWEKVLG